MVGSKDTELSTLIVTNSQLTATNASLTGQLLEMVGLQERVGTLQDENARLLDEVGGLGERSACRGASWTPSARRAPRRPPARPPRAAGTAERGRRVRFHSSPAKR